MQRLVTTLFILLIFLAAALPGQAVDRSVIRIPIPGKSGGTKEVELYRGSYALVIGASNYTGGWPPLPGVAEDVQAVAQALRDKGFDVTTVLDPTSDQLEQAFEDFITAHGDDPDSRLLFYFAGHGHTLTPSWSKEPMGYIVPVDAPLPDKDPRGFKRKAMNMQRVEEYALEINAKHALFLFDACFSGSLFALSRAVPESINYKTAKPVRQFITSGSEDETVPDESVFRKQFVSGIQGEADRDGDGYITGAELGSFLQDTVVNYSRGSQHPQYGKIRRPELDKGDFVFVGPGDGQGGAGGGGGGGTVARLAPPVPPININAEEELWLAVKRSKDIEDFQMYLEKYPNGRFADIAVLKISQLRRAQGKKDNRPRLFIHPDPPDARVRLKNSNARYEPGVALDPGTYMVEVSRQGYETEVRKVRVDPGQEVNVIVALRPVPAASAATPQATAKPAVQPAPKAQPEVDLWLSVRDSNDPERLRAYLEQYPDGSFAPLARLRMERLRRHSSPAARRPRPGPGRPAPQAASLSRPRTLALTVRTEPAGARVRILNIRPRYHDGIRLRPGSYEIEVSKPGYRTAVRKVTLDDKPLRLTVRLEKEEDRKAEPQARKQDFPRHRNFKEQVTGIEFVWVPGGCFKMGSGDYESGRGEDEGPQHKVCVSDFWASRHEITNRQYRVLVPGHDSGSYKGKDLNRDDQPVVRVNWEEARDFASRLNSLSGGRFRLPTEAEWEYMARAGTAQGGQSKSRYWGASPSEACRYANVADKTAKAQVGIRRIHRCSDGFAVTAPVGSFLPNAFNLYDMLGNASEWCQDKYSAQYYSLRIEDNPTGPTIFCPRRVARGGSWMDRPARVRAAARIPLKPGVRREDLGFRLVMPAD